MSLLMQSNTLMDSRRLNVLNWQTRINLGQGLDLAYQEFKHEIGF